jgi:hypothetical protein
MRDATKATVETLLEADKTITPEHRTRIMRELARGDNAHEKLFTCREAAAFLDPGHPLHPATMRRWEKRGLLHPVRFTARRIRYRESELLALRAGGVCRA